MALRRVSLLLTLSALAAASACSSGSPSSTAGPSPASASPASGGSASASPAATATSSATISTAPITVQVGLLTEEFTTPLPADPARANVVTGFEQGLVLWDKSDENFALVSPVTSWVTGAALNDLKQSLSSEAQTELVPAGIDRIFNTAVTALNGSRATLTTCDDGSKYQQENPRTHAFNTTPVPLDQQYLFITWGMTEVSGHWAVTSVTIASSSSAAEKSCRP